MPIAPRRHPACGGRRQEREIKGIIFSLLEEVVVNEHGENAWDDTLERAALDGAYTAVGNYPDSEFLQLLAALPAATDQQPETQLRWFGAGRFRCSREDTRSSSKATSRHNRSCSRSTTSSIPKSESSIRTPTSRSSTSRTKGRARSWSVTAPHDVCASSPRGSSKEPHPTSASTSRSNSASACTTGTTAAISCARFSDHGRP